MFTSKKAPGPILNEVIIVRPNETMPIIDVAFVREDNAEIDPIKVQLAGLPWVTFPRLVQFQPYNTPVQSSLHPFPSFPPKSSHSASSTTRKSPHIGIHLDGENVVPPLHFHPLTAFYIHVNLQPF